MPELQDFNSVREVASFLRVSVKHLYNVINGGGMAHLKVGKTVRIRREHVMAYLAANTHEAKKEEKR